MAPDFGPNVHIFDDSMTDIQAQIAGLFPAQDGGIEVNEFGTSRHAYFFKPNRPGGTYGVDVHLGYYTTVHGLGASPDEVTITGGVQCLGVGDDRLALNNFWRGGENFAVVSPTVNNINKWAVSQATYLRRFHLGNSGQLFLFDWKGGPAGFASGGFVANSQIDGGVSSGSQQQFLTRNTSLMKWDGGLWNMVFVGDEQAPLSSWGTDPKVPPYTVVDQTSLVREKPYLVINSSGDYEVKVPALKTGSQGPSWDDTNATTIPIDRFYIAKEGTDTTETLNNALRDNLSLILTPGIYHLTDSLQIIHDNTIVLGLGMATLIPDRGTPALTIADVGGVSICGIIIDAGPQQSSSLLLAGTGPSSTNHSTNPIALYDVSCRVGGAGPGLAQSCIVINVNDLIIDNVWIWRADHGVPGSVGWVENAADNGLTVNGDRVTAYGLFVEHFQGFQTVWNGNDGHVYFYQSEIPYDVPSQAAWQQNGEKGFPSYKVSNSVTRHTAIGLGIYCFFRDTEGVQLENAIETPTGPDIHMNHMVTKWLNGKEGTSINHIINGTGGMAANSIAHSHD